MSRRRPVILVALDASRDSLAIVPDAARLARRMGAELVGLYVEDENLVRLAEHPAVREVLLWSGTARSVTERALRRALSAQASAARRAVAAAAAEAAVPWSFEVAQGFVAHEVVFRAREADLVIVGRSRSQRWRRRNLGATLAAVIARTHTPLLVLSPGQIWRSPVAAVFDGSAAGHHALEVAARLLPGEAQSFVVFVPSTGEAESTANLVAAAHAAAAGLGPWVEVIPITTPVYSVVCDAMHARGASVLVVHTQLRFVEDDAIERLVVYLDCPVLVTPWQRESEETPLLEPD